MKYFITLLIWITGFVFIHAQTPEFVLFVNPSFEGKLPLKKEVLPNGWENCGWESTPDIQPGFWGVDAPPFDGHSYIQLVCRENKSYETVTQKLSGTLYAGTKYCFTIYLATVLRGDTPALFRVWGGDDMCKKDQQLWVSQPIDHPEWEQYCICFTPTADITNLAFDVYFVDDSGVFPHATGNIMIDHLSEKITIDHPPKINLGNDTTICEGDSLVWSFSQYPGNTFFYWQGNILADTFVAKEAGTYFVKVIWEGVVFHDTMNLSIQPIPKVELGKDTLLCIGQELILDATFPDATYLWDDTQSSGPSTFLVQAPGSHRVWVTASGCTATDDITVDYQDCEHYLEFPNVFTPNGDGINDIFRPMQAKGLNQFELKIFDRWGRTVFTTPHWDTGWNGYSGTSRSPAGVYYWYAKYVDVLGNSFQQKGSLTLLR